MNILGIETSCDETSASIVVSGNQLKSNVVASQDELHEPFGGIVPEVAARCHIERIDSIVKTALHEAGITIDDVDGVAVTAGPGLMGSLIVGLSYAKGIAYSKKLPLCGINHLEAHLHAIFIEEQVDYPYIGLIVSGGHTALYDVRGVGEYSLIGTTKDDAAGEAFDKVAKLLGLGYPGGKKIDELSKNGDRTKIAFPRANLKESGCHFSFSGLKTSVLQYYRKLDHTPSPQELADIAASFQEAVAQPLVEQSLKAVKQKGYSRLVVAGGVAANSRLRAVFGEKSREVKVFFPSIKLCTDNAAMVSALGYHYLKEGRSDPLTLKAYPNI